ncbi:MAG: hypothetical protein M1144_01405, partial [Candidatus Thermoplasmatota archaeon]|nr:hypothetical protein [Candidatus Thermoplasmatota archaeon]
GDEGSLLLPLDHAFPVRGVGTVALGLVERGRVKAHDRLRLFQPASKFQARYGTLGFNDKAKLDDGTVWPTSFAIKELSGGDEARIAALVKKAVS